MAIIVKSIDSATAVLPATGDTVIVEDGVTVSSSADALAGFSATDLNVYVAGIFAGEDNGGEVGGNSVVSIAATGAMIGRSAGLWLNGVGTAVTNDGTIQSFGTGISFALAGIVLNGASNVTLTNNGTIASGDVGIALFGGGIGNVLDNAGSLTAAGSAVTGTGGIGVHNTGRIVSGATAFDLFSDTAGALHLINNGIIRGIIAINASDTQDDVVHNFGLCDGSVRLNGGADRYVGSGTVAGDVDLGAGDDLYRGTGEGLVDGRILGGLGLDTIRGGAEDDVADGGALNDLLSGRAGDDKLFGGDGNDVISGGAGDDTLDSGSGKDLFVYRDDFGVDEIDGFSVKQDRIDLSALSGIASFADLQRSHLFEPNGDAVIEAGDGSVLVLRNVHAAELTAANFIF